MVFKVSILPIIKVVSSLFIHLIFIWIMIIVYLLFGVQPSLWWIQIFYYTFCTLFLVLGLSYITASANAFFKDMGQTVQILLQIGMWLAPIMWSETMFPVRFRFVIKLNPVYYLVQGYRDCFITHEGFWEHPQLTVYFWCIVLIIFGIGMNLFKRLKPHFADVL